MITVTVWNMFSENLPDKQGLPLPTIRAAIDHADTAYILISISGLGQLDYRYRRVSGSMPRKIAIKIT
jgi:hypothetical protein